MYLEHLSCTVDNCYYAVISLRGCCSYLLCFWRNAVHNFFQTLQLEQACAGNGFVFCLKMLKFHLSLLSRRQQFHS